MIDYYLDLTSYKPPLVHSFFCCDLPRTERRKHLGKYMGPEGALFVAKEYNKNAMLCPLCKNDHFMNSQFIIKDQPAVSFSKNHS